MAKVLKTIVFAFLLLQATLVRAQEDDTPEEPDDDDMEDPVKIMEQFDQDKDGALTMDEIMKEVEDEGDAEEQAEARTKIQEHFDKADSNKDGKLDSVELPVMMNSLRAEEEL
mmetsp:Transcript_68882/g.109276  ORF Transcript_68882/g.109276 Transcript_68882/m.109276 type:complete len:113 (-) Transcript_68882:44-382(-)